MQLLDRDIGDSRALVVDSNPTSRSILMAQLRDFGVGTVVQCSRVHEARRVLEDRAFDIVLCEHGFAGSADYSGQDLVDDLRRNQLLPLSTVFIMVTGEASYTMVADAAESALDGYLLKPYSATVLGQRLTQARHRKKSLADVFTAIEQQNYEHGARLCMQRYQEGGAYRTYAARLGCELLLRIGKHDAARQLYETVLKTAVLPWAKLGIARTQIEANQPGQAIQTLAAVIADHPSYVDAQDVLGRVQLEQGELTEALAAYRQASTMTPGSISRLQRHGMLAFYLDEREESAKVLERAASLGANSKMFDPQSLVLLALTRLQQRDGKAVQRCLDALLQAFSKDPESPRLRRFVSVVRIFTLMMQRENERALVELRELTAELREPSLDVEAASNLLGLLAELGAAQTAPADAASWVETLALRFASSKNLTEMLARAAGRHAPYAEIVRKSHERISELAEEAVSNTLLGDHRAAVQSLLAHGESTLNGKLLDLARMTLQRHQARISDADALSAAIEALRRLYPVAVPLLGMGLSGGRQAGALNLRDGNPAATAKAA